MNLSKYIGKVLTSKSVGTGPSSYEKRIYRAAVSQRLKNTDLQRFVALIFLHPQVRRERGRTCFCRKVRDLKIVILKGPAQ